jgi:hypothetical protein
MEDNLLTKCGDVKHQDVKQEANEEFTPTLLNVLVTCWLNVLNPSLVRQRFSTQLRCNTAYTLREEISDAIPTLSQKLRREKEMYVVLENIRRERTLGIARPGSTAIIQTSAIAVCAK